MAEPVLSDLYMNEGFEGGAAGDAVDGQPHYLGHNMTTIVINKNLLLGLQVFLTLMLIFFIMGLFYSLRKSWTAWRKRQDKHHGSHRSHYSDY